MKRYFAIAVVALVLVLPGPASALSCAAPILDEPVVDAAVMIFEGTAGRDRRLSSREKAAVRKHAVRTIGGGTGDLRVYSFVVTRGWKGATPGQSVDVLINGYWGDGFAEGEAYLVVSPQQVGTLFLSPLCGHTVDIGYAADNGLLDTLQRVTGKD